MSTAVANLVGEHLVGQQAANRFIDSLRNETLHPDALHVAAMKVWASGGSGALLGFHRVLMKRLERANEPARRPHPTRVH